METVGGYNLEQKQADRADAAAFDARFASAIGHLDASIQFALLKRLEEQEKRCAESDVLRTNLRGKFRERLILTLMRTNGQSGSEISDTIAEVADLIEKSRKIS